MKKVKNKTPKIHPRSSWVLVRPFTKEKNETEYGIIIPDSVEKEKKAQGEVIEVGPKVEGLKKGDIVLYGMYAGEEIQFGSKEEQKDKVDLLLLMDEDILAFVEA